VIDTSRQLRAAIGAALLPAIADAVTGTGAGIALGDRAAMLTGAIGAGLATLVALIAQRTLRPAKAHT
jgi:hypothetical protein